MGININNQGGAFPNRPKTKVKLSIFEDKELNTSILDTSNGVIEYDIIVWTEEGEQIFEKSGKTSKEKLSDALSFNASVGVIHNVHLTLSVVVNGKKYNFVTLSPFNTLIDDYLKVIESSPKGRGPKFSFEPSFDMSEQWIVDTVNGLPVQIEKGYDVYDVTYRIASSIEEYQNNGAFIIYLFLINEKSLNDIIFKYIGKLPLDLGKQILAIEDYSLTAKLNQKALEIEKKQKLGSLYSNNNESLVLDIMNSETLYSELMKLLTVYDNVGFDNLSPYRQSIYKHLKTAVDSLVVVKGKLENI